jgi:FixJ family two-component response regulator
MPVMSGEETLVELQRLCPTLQIVLSSGYTEVEAYRRFGDKEFAGFIQKPYTTTRLVSKITEILSD